jgi:hypothetical protein
MNRLTALLAAMAISSLTAPAEVTIDEEALGKSLGGWTKRSKQAAEYVLSGTTYRTYRPEITPTPDGGIFASVRIDHVRGWLSSDDHAILEVTMNSKGMIVSAQSNIAIQGRSISSDVILGAGGAGKQLGGAERAVQIGTEMVADLSAKLLREKIVEAGRVSFPAALRHNYNLLFQGIRVDGFAPNSTPAAAPVPPDGAEPVPVAPQGDVSKTTEPSTDPGPPGTPKQPEVPTTAPTDPPAENKPLEIKPYETPKAAELPTNG